MGEIKRKPILTVNNRRNAENNPEFLDTEVLLERFEPLLKSIHRRFLSYQGIFMNSDDVSDLYSQIVLEFLRLRQAFDPKRGVDFTGYIKFHLQQRVYHYVMKKQKVVLNEQLVRSYSDDFDDKSMELESLSRVVDEQTPVELEKAEAIASIPWDDLSEEQSQLVTDILINRKTIEDIAKSRKVTIKSVKQQFDEVCEYLAELHELSDKRDEWLSLYRYK